MMICIQNVIYINCGHWFIPADILYGEKKLIGRSDAFAGIISMCNTHKKDEEIKYL